MLGQQDGIGQYSLRRLRHPGESTFGLCSLRGGNSNLKQPRLWSVNHHCGMLMAMNAPIIAAALALLSATSAQAAERRFTITSFNKIQVDGPFEVTLATGRSPSAFVSGTPQAIERVSLEVQGQVLRVRPNRSAWGGYPGQGAGPLKISVSTHELRSAAVAGSGSIVIDKAKAMRFDLSVAGSGRIGIAALDADTLFVGLVGAGKITLAGKAKELIATLKGSGDLDGAAFVAEEAKINADTAGAVVIAVRRAANVTSTGQGDTRIVGNPACQVKAQGVGQVVCGR